MVPFGFIEPSGMNKPGEKTPIPDPEPSRTEQARRIIEEYANDLREIIKKLRRHMD
jgi:hypothetical protein